MLRKFIVAPIFWLVVPSICFAQSAVPSLGLERYPNVDSARNVIETWNPDQHLYIKGDLGIANQQLARLESWLDQNAPHWTVVLMRNVKGESYISLDGRSFAGMDAVEYALGRGLALRTTFSELHDARTGETDGAVFVLFLDERKFSYYASEAQDVRQLGESHWVGELDRPAFRAMRGGGRILDAVKMTITNINTRLTEKINAEQEQAEREKRARERAALNLKNDISALRKSITQVDAKALMLKQDNPEAKGELTVPPTDRWQSEVAEIEAVLNLENVAKTRGQFNQISHQVEGYLNSYAVYETFEDAAAPIESGIDDLKSDAIAEGRPLADEASRELAAARSAMKKGDRGIAEFISKASDLLNRGRQANADERDRIARAAARTKLIWTTITIIGVLLSLVFVAILVWLNRRRLPAMKRAQGALAASEARVKAEMEKVYGLFEQSAEILGDRENVKKRGYEGTTKKLSDNAFEDVDDLFVMSSEVERVMQEAREMVYPNHVSRKLANLISSSPYEYAINRISGEPLVFHRDRGLPLVITRESERTGDEPPDEVTMTFDKVFEAFRERTATAENTLLTIENSLLQVDDSLVSLQEEIETATSIDRELASAAEADGMFSLPAFFEKLIPAAQAEYDKADETMAADPVQAMQVHIPNGSRKIRDALSIAKTIQAARKHIFPQLNDYAPRLQEFQYNTDWIQQNVDQLGDRANGLLERAVRCSIGDEAAEFSEDVSALAERAKRTLEIALSVSDTVAPSLNTLERKIAEARKQIAATLKLPEDRCLSEYEADPDVKLATGRELLAATQVALQHGGVEAALQSQGKLDAELKVGHVLIDNSLRILGEFDGTLLKCRQHLDAVRDKVPRHEQLLEGIRQKYECTSLVLQAGDPSYDDPAATVDTHLVGCRDSLGDAESLIHQANVKYREGQLLSADHMLTMAAGHVEEADQNLDEIDQHCAKLEQVSQKNEGRLTALQREIERFGNKVADRRTMRPTMQEYQRVLNALGVAEHEVRHTLPRDPFRDQTSIHDFSEMVSNIESRIEADHESHAEATRALQGAKNERSIAEQLVNQARHDGIPDSPVTTASIHSIQSHDGELARIERELNTDHDDWKVVDQAATRIHGELSVEAGRLRGELQRAERLVGIFKGASDSVFEATRWTGGFGTRIFGTPGSAELEQARQALNQGDYSAMAELARAAQIVAQQAIQRAQREVYRRQREEARRAEAARRQRRQSSINIGGGGFGGGARGGGGSSSSSSSGGGSSSGSGFSRSGW